MRFLEDLDSIEASPVMLGAGENTGTDMIKGLNGGLTLPDHADQVLAGLEAFKARITSLADVRAKEGRSLSTANLERLKAHHGTLIGLASELGDFLASFDTPKGGEVADIGDVLSLMAEYERIEARLLGVA